MIAVPILSISIGAAIGALLRWGLGLSMNHLFPTIPLGTLSANLIGGFLMGVLVALTKDVRFISETMKLALFTGFLGSLTTFSTFSAETVNLLTHQQYFWSSIMIIGHVAGSLFATFLGLYVVRVLVY
ncbi:MAG: putative fluoride ion transporter CrcB [Candidatus Anoxychlamydiales bacterium]|nr:putative fluoride ion transporter CrcB [Candidatus Anoxychlamydiales bacterium]NGX35394.1 putative fluoride ion transporter CrcB [Candidatus Anoxychlamydiales bacterium]